MAVYGWVWTDDAGASCFVSSVGEHEMNVAIIVAGGVGTRLGLGFNKAFAEILGKPVLAYSVQAFQDSPSVDSIIVVCGGHHRADGALERKKVYELQEQYQWSKLSAVVPGGATRNLSVESGLQAANLLPESIVFVHDAARPLVTGQIIDSVFRGALETGAAVCALRPKDTIARAGDGKLGEVLNREELVAIQTPVAARWNFLREARSAAFTEGYAETPGFEDSALLVRYGVSVVIVQGSEENIKVTTPEDLPVAQQILQVRAKAL